MALDGTWICIPNFMAIDPIVVDTVTRNHRCLVVELEEKSGDHQSHKITSSGNHECLYKILQSKEKKERECSDNTIVMKHRIRCQILFSMKYIKNLKVCKYTGWEKWEEHGNMI